MLVVWFKLVFVGGVMVINVMLYNEDEVWCKDVCVGDIVIVWCVGDVIFEVVVVVLEKCLKCDLFGDELLYLFFVMLSVCLECDLVIEKGFDEVIVCCFGGFYCLV